MSRREICFLLGNRFVLWLCLKCSAWCVCFVGLVIGRRFRRPWFYLFNFIKAEPPTKVKLIGIMSFSLNNTSTLSLIDSIICFFGGDSFVVRYVVTS
eukprot:GHVS01070999.1.p1 GENE.GHVS01070999.1~~GHVS01070999.1.p1  ORF type:complete len:111 (-),score=7.40 GHVS01070999.1:37-327(-)